MNPICPDFQHVSSSTLFLMSNWLPDFLTVTRISLLKFINACTSFRKHLSWMNIMYMSMLPKTTMEQSWKLQDQRIFSATVSQHRHCSLLSSMANVQMPCLWNDSQKVLRQMASSFPQIPWLTGWSKVLMYTCPWSTTDSMNLSMTIKSYMLMSHR